MPSTFALIKTTIISIYEYWIYMNNVFRTRPQKPNITNMSQNENLAK